MPIISKIGSRTLKVKIVYFAMFFILIIGSISMIYPFMLMIAGSFRSNADSTEGTPVPKYFWNDTILFQKYCESKYNGETQLLQVAWGKDNILSWRMIVPPKMNKDEKTLLEDYLIWRQKSAMPLDWYVLGHIRAGTPGALRGLMLLKNKRLFCNYLSKIYNNNIDKFTKATGIYTPYWITIEAPFREFPYSRIGKPKVDIFLKEFNKFRKGRPIRDKIMLISIGLTGDII